MCDASAAVPLGDRRVIIADDEDNVLRIYDTRGGAAISMVDLSPALNLQVVGSKQPHYPETDLEAGAIVGNKALWLSSHGRSSDGEAKSERLRLFATTLDDTPAIYGRVYTTLLDDLLADPRLTRYDLRSAIERAPKAEGGFNIEGMTSTPSGGVLIGLRNPVRAGKAIVVPLTNPIGVIEGAAPIFGEPSELDLGGRGVRAMSYWRGRYLVAGGSATDSLALLPALYTWDGEGSAQLVVPELDTLNPEAFYSPDARDEVLIFSDDGTALVDGVPCKKLADAAKKSFRAAWISLGKE